MRVSSIPSPSRLKDRTGDTEGQPVLSLGYPLLFHWLVIVCALGLLLFAAIRSLVPLLAVTVFYLVFALGSRLWSRYSLRDIAFRFKLVQARAFPGERIDLVLDLANRKWLFLPWLDIEVELPWRLATGQLKKLSPYSKERLTWNTSVSGRQSLQWKHSLECKARGDYQLGPVHLRSGDMLGLFPGEVILPHFQSLLVYPRIVPLGKLRLPLNELIGESAASRNLYEDMSRTAGTRAYRPDDPLKRIHWKASAHQSQLQVRQYESTTSLNLLLVLDVFSFAGDIEDNAEMFELALTIAASTADEVCRQQLSFGLLANSFPEIEIPVSNGRQQLLTILETLARMESVSRLPLEKYLDKHTVNLPYGTTLLLITHNVSDSLLAAVQKLRREGNSLLLVYVGTGDLAASISGIPIISVRSIADFSSGCSRVKL